MCVGVGISAVPSTSLFHKILMMCSDLIACSSRAGAMSIRQADMTDLDAMVDVGLAALPMDPQWDYRLRYRKQYPDDTHKFTRQRFKIFLENEPGNLQVMVAELPSREDSSISKVAAFAAWRLPPVDHVMVSLSADKAHKRE